MRSPIDRVGDGVGDVPARREAAEGDDDGRRTEADRKVSSRVGAGASGTAGGRPPEAVEGQPAGQSLGPREDGRS